MTASDPEHNYIVLEEIDGRPLTSHFRKPVGLREAVRVTLLLSQIVQDCHRKGVIHRDIKPDNILINSSGDTVWLIDFGMVWAEASELQSVTESGDRGGNAFIRLPEMEPSTTEAKRDLRSDATFTCGILFWLLTLNPPVVLLDQNRLMPHERALDGKLVSVQADPKWPLVKSIFDRGFSYDIDFRFQNISELIKKLEEVLDLRKKEMSEKESEERVNKMLQEYKNREPIRLREQAQNAAMNFSQQLAFRFYDKAQRTNLTFLSNNVAIRLGDCYQVPLRLKLNQGDTNEVHAVHRICFHGNQRSQVSASYGFGNEAMEVQEWKKYYEGGTADVDGLERAIRDHEAKIWAKMVERLLDKAGE